LAVVHLASQRRSSQTALERTAKLRCGQDPY
jgi:hypothetical protein